MSYCCTYTGVKWNVLDPSPDDVRIEDIAHALSLNCRFNGQVKEFYSVAEHSVRLTEEIPTSYPSCFKLAALLHDAAEAYLGDVIAPLKKFLPVYTNIETCTQRVIAKAFNLLIHNFDYTMIKQLDRVMLVTEARDLMHPRFFEIHKGWNKKELPDPLPGKIEPWESWEAEQRFIETYWRIVDDSVSSGRLTHTI